MSKYKIDIDTKLPSEEKIQKSMDFEKVLKTASSKKRPRCNPPRPLVLLIQNLRTAGRPSRCFPLTT